MLEQRQCRTRQPTLPYDKHIRRPQSYTPDFSMTSWRVEVTKRELVSREEEECLTKSLSRRPTSKAGAPLPGHPGTQAAAAEGAIHILVCDARRAAEPALLRNMLTFSRGRWGTSTNILDTSRLRGEIALLPDSTVEKMGSWPRLPFNSSSCPTG